MSIPRTASFGRIGKYVVQGELGRSAACNVYRALDPTVGRPVAIKILTAETSEDVISRFKREAAAAASLQHQNIVTIYELGEHQGRPFIAMEFLAGEDLSDVIAARKPLGLLEKVMVMAQVADGLACAHRNGVVHRDVRPANIRLLPDGTARILDFGIARVMGEGAARLTAQGQAIGSMLYMAPEQLTGADPDATSDIFAYGITYYEFLTGRHPFHPAGGASALPLADGDPEPIQSFVPECPAALDQVIRRALQRERELRYHSLEDLQFDAEAVLIELRQERSVALFQQAREALDQQQTERALPILHESLALDPTNRAARELRDALRLQSQRLAMKPRVDELTAKASAAAAEERLSEAIGYLESALRLDRDNQEALASLKQLRDRAERRTRATTLTQEARRQFERNDLVVALERVSAAVELDPDCTEARELLARVQAEIERRDRQQRVDEKLEEARELLGQLRFDATIAVIESLDPADRTSPEAENLYRSSLAAKRESERQEHRRSELDAIGELLDRLSFAAALERLEQLQAEYSGDETVAGLTAFARQELEEAGKAAGLERACREVLALADAGSFDGALQKLEQELQARPAEPGLMRLRDRVLAAQARHKDDQAVRDALHRAGELRAQARHQEALEGIEAVLQVHRGDALLERLRDSIRNDLAEARRRQALRAAIEKARAAMEAGDATAAVGQLEAAAAEATDPPLEDEFVQARAQLAKQSRLNSIESLKREARAHGEAGRFDTALDLVEAGLVRFSGESSLEQLRLELESAKAISRALAGAAALTEAGQSAAAVQLLKAAVDRYPQAPELSSALSRASDQLNAEKRAESVAQARREIRTSIRQGRLDSAQTKLEAAATEFPGDASVEGLRQEVVAARRAVDARRQVSVAMRDAENLRSQNRLAEADKILTDALGVSPAEPRLLQLRRAVGEAMEKQRRAEDVRRVVQDADAHISAGEPERAMLVLREAARNLGSDAEVSAATSRAEEAFRRRERSEALAGAVQEIRGWTEDGQFSLALERCEAAASAWGEDPELVELRKTVLAAQAARAGSGEVARALRRSEALAGHLAFDAALQSLTPVLMKFPDDAGLREAYERISSGFERQRRTDASASIAEAEALISKGDAGQAVDVLKRAQKEWPGLPEIGAALARADAALGATTRQQQFRAALEGCESLLTGGRLDEAARVLEQALVDFPDEPALEILRERLRQAWERTERAEAVQRALDEAKAVVERGDPAQAVALLELACARYPGYARLTAALGEARAMARKREREIEDVCEKTRLYVADENFEQALETVQENLLTFTGEHRLTDLREAVLAARAQWNQANFGPPPGPAARLSPPGLSDDTRVLPAAAPAPEPPNSPAPPPRRFARRTAIGVFAGALLAGGGWLGANRLRHPTGTERAAVLKALDERSGTIELRPAAEPKIQGDTATVRCLRTGDGDQRPWSQVTVRLVKTSGGHWQIQSVTP